MDDSSVSFSLGGVLLTLLLAAGYYVWSSLALAAVFRRLGEEGWKAWVPIYNTVTIFRLGGVSALWVITLFSPFSIVGLVFFTIAQHRINQRFGRGVWFTVLAVVALPIWASILGWGGPPRRPVTPSAQPAPAVPTATAGVPAAYGHPAAPNGAQWQAAAQAAVQPVLGQQAPAQHGGAAQPAYAATEIPTRLPFASPTVAAATPTAAPAAPAEAGVAATPVATHFATPSVEQPSPVAPQYSAPTPPVTQPAPPASVQHQPAPAPSFGQAGFAQPLPPPVAPVAGAAESPLENQTVEIARLVETPPAAAAETPLAAGQAEPIAVALAEHAQTEPPAFSYTPPVILQFDADVVTEVPNAPIEMPVELSVRVEQPEASEAAAAKPLIDAVPDFSAVATAAPAQQPAASIVLSAPGSGAGIGAEADEADDMDETIIAGRRNKAWIFETGEGQRVPMTSTVVILGRNPSPIESYPDAQLITVRDPERTISKMHARVELRDGAWVITDLNSTNGVYLVASDDEELELDAGQTAALGDRFVLGEVSARIFQEE